jgi:hypothetical protein
MGNRVGLYRHEERGERTGARFGVGLCGLTVVGSILQFFNHSDWWLAVFAKLLKVANNSNNTYNPNTYKSQ